MTDQLANLNTAREYLAQMENELSELKKNACYDGAYAKYLQLQAKKANKIVLQLAGKV